MVYERCHIGYSLTNEQSHSAASAIIFCPIHKQQFHNGSLHPYETAWNAFPDSPMTVFISAPLSSSSFTTASLPPYDAAWTHQQTLGLLLQTTADYSRLQ